MKNITFNKTKTSFGRMAVLLFPLLMLSGCMKEKNFKTYTLMRPEYRIKQQVKDAVRIMEPKAIKNAGSFVLYNNTMYINERNEGLHVVDYSNPASPQNRGFIPLPGNTGVAIKNNILYADCYSDLFILKLVSGNQVELQDAVSNVFTSRMDFYTYDTNAVEVIWHKKDTTVTEEYYNQYYLSSYKADGLLLNSSPTPATPGGGVSAGSSMAVFAIVNDFLYTVDQSNLNTFWVSDLLHPVLKNSQHVNWDVETIFPFKDKLFVGSMTGMFMYSIQDPATPTLLGQFNHARVCDPVVADDKYAYVTLRNGTTCGGFENQLDVINIENVSSPVLVRSFVFTNPHGLSKDGNVLFVCDGNAGLKIVDAGDPTNLVIKQTIVTPGKAIDVLAYNQLAFVMLDNAIQIYSYDQQFNVQLLGNISK